MRTGVQITLLTALFAGVYVALREIPSSSCSFLHYDQTVVAADGMEFCGGAAAYFVDLEKLPFPVTLELAAEGAPQVGVETHYTLTIRTSDLRPLPPSKLAVTMTRKLHLLVVDASLEDYIHIHPDPVDDSGTWTFSFTPRRPGPYRVYAQFIPTDSLREMTAETQIKVPGETGPAVHRGLAPYKDGDYVYHLTASEEPLTVNTNETLTLSVQRADGGRVQLQPVMGTLAHLVVFEARRIGVAHLHPTLSDSEKDPTHPELTFLINLAEPGHYRLWGQVKIDGTERYVPFDIEVAKAE